MWCVVSGMSGEGGEGGVCSLCMCVCVHAYTSLSAEWTLVLPTSGASYLQILRPCDGGGV